MPVRKFRDVSEMGDTRWHEPGDPKLFQAMAQVWGLAARMSQMRFPPGVYRHRSLEEAQRCRESWEAAAYEAGRRRRGD